MSTDSSVTPKWLELANSNPNARAYAAGAEPFLVAHGVPHETFSAAGKRGDYVSTIFSELDRVGHVVKGDQLSGQIADTEIVEFFKSEIERAATKRTTIAHE